jgi:gas vesicle protein
MNTTAKLIAGFVTGAAVGTIAGMLIGPDKRTNTNTLKKGEEEAKHLGDDIADSTRLAQDKEHRKEAREVENRKWQNRPRT